MSYIKLNRSLLDSHSFANPNHLKIWIWMLLKANYKNAFVPINTGRGTITVEVKRGQLIFGRFKAEEELNINGTMVYRTIKQFEELGQIKVEVNSHFSLITICKYDSYQGQINESEQATNNQWSGNEQHMNNTRTTHEQHMNIYKEELEEKEEIKELKINNPFSENFIEFWDQWKEYKKKQHKFTFKQKSSEETSINQLYKLSNGNELNAKAIIDQSIANGWKGFFELKTTNNGNSKKQTGVEQLLAKAKRDYEAYTGGNSNL